MRRHSRRAILAAGVLAVTLSGGALALAGFAAWAIVQPGGNLLGTTLLLVGFAFVSFLGLATTYGLGELVLEDSDRKGDEAVAILDEARRGVAGEIHGPSALRVGEAGPEVVRTYYGAHWPDPGE